MGYVKEKLKSVNMVKPGRLVVRELQIKAMRFHLYAEWPNSNSQNLSLVVFQINKTFLYFW